MIRVLIADDHDFVRSALSDLLSATDDISVVATCPDGCDVVETTARTAPDVVLMDLSMPVMGGLEATAGLRAAHPDVRVIVLTGSLDAAAAWKAHTLGVCGFLLKTDGPDTLPGHIRAVAAGGTAWHPTAAQVLASGR
jgi:DNA-binding NarL/FixJ family response regulator